VPGLGRVGELCAACPGDGIIPLEDDDAD